MFSGPIWPIGITENPAIADAGRRIGAISHVGRSTLGDDKLLREQLDGRRRDNE